MDFGLRDRLVVVTGAARGIGRATAVGFGAEGARVVITYHGNEPGARQAAEEVRAAGGDAYVRHLDLSDEDSVARLSAGLHTELGPVDVLVNNSVAWPALPLRQAKSLCANLYGHYLLSRALVGPMRERGWGRIVFVSDAGPVPGGLARTITRELAGEGVQTHVVTDAPARTATELAGAIITRCRPTGSPITSGQSAAPAAVAG